MRNSAAILVGWLAAFIMVFLVAGASPVEAAATKGAPEQEIIANGKAVCSLKIPVAMPYPGTVTKVNAASGQQVKQGEDVVRYNLDAEMALQLRRRVSYSALAELELRMAQIDEKLGLIENKLKETKQLASQNLAPAQGWKQLENDSARLAKQRNILTDRLKVEKAYLNENISLISGILGLQVAPDSIPKEGRLTAPVAGHIISVNPDLRVNAPLGAGTYLMTIGQMDPMLVMTQLHELEAVKIKLGDRAEVVLEAYPGRKFQAKVSRISWAPIAAGPDQPSYYEVELTVPNPDFTIKEGQRGQITFLPGN